MPPIPPPPPAGEGRGGGARSASAGTFVGKLAIGLEAAFVNAFQAFRDDCLQLANLFLLFGFSRIHRNRFYDVNCDEGDGMRPADNLTASLSETPTE